MLGGVGFGLKKITQKIKKKKMAQKKIFAKIN